MYVDQLERVFSKSKRSAKPSGRCSFSCALNSVLDLRTCPVLLGLMFFVIGGNVPEWRGARISDF